MTERGEYGELCELSAAQIKEELSRIKEEAAQVPAPACACTSERFCRACYERACEGL